MQREVKWNIHIIAISNENDEANKYIEYNVLEHAIMPS